MSEGPLSFLSNPAFWVLGIAGLVFSIVQYYQWQSTVAAAKGGQQNVPIGKGLLGLLAAAIGVVISYFVVQKRFDLTAPNIAGAAIATAPNAPSKNFFIALSPDLLRLTYSISDSPIMIEDSLQIPKSACIKGHTRFF